MWFDPFVASFADDPYPAYRRLRDQTPVYISPTSSGDLYVLSRHEDVHSALNDWARFSSVSPDCSPSATHGNQLIQTDPPYHDRLRALVKQPFSPRRIKGLTETVRTAAASLVRRVPETDTLDIAAEFAWPLTVKIASDLVGVPEADRASVLSWYIDYRYSGEPSSAAGSLLCYREYFDDLASRRLARPETDLVSELMQAHQLGLISRGDAVVMAIDLFEGAIDVPANLLGNAVVALVDRADQRALLSRDDLDPTSLRVAVEELARFDAPIQHLPRCTSEPIRIHDTEIPAGSLVRLLLGSANRDERQHHDPDRLDLTRPPVRNVAFGAGVHFCIGAPLARLVTTVAIPELLSAIPDYRLALPVVRPRGDDSMRAILNLRIEPMLVHRRRSAARQHEPPDDAAMPAATTAHTESLRVVVDLIRCEGHGQCVLAAPEVFRLDAGLGVGLIAPIPECFVRDIERAAILCPTQAISVQDIARQG